jgi:hypothetical protein
MDVSIEKQTEINEWSYNSKRDTLFFFQLVFIGLTILIIMYSLSAAGLLSDIFVMYIMIIIFVLLGLIWYTKFIYTRNNRDKQHWNKIVFPEDGKKPSALPANVVSSVATATTEKCSKNSVSGSSSGSASGRLTGSAAARNRDGSLYGDKNNDGRLGNYDTTGGGFQAHPEDASTQNLNERQGQAYNNLQKYLSKLKEDGSYSDSDINLASQFIDSKVESSPQSITGRIAWCEKNLTSYEPIENIPCKRFLCMADPTRKIKSVTTLSGVSSNVEIPCKTLFPNL